MLNQRLVGRSLYPQKRVDLKILFRYCKDIFIIIETTSNFWDALALVFKAHVFKDQRSKDITFRNGITVSLNWREYSLARNLVSNNYIVNKVDGLFLIKKGKMKLVGPPDLIDVVNEKLDKIYICECKNKIVLDIGGFIGDTAVLFSNWGAKKVIIYEPVISLHKFIKMNVILNGFEAELHEEGIGDENGYRTVHYDTVTDVFGLEDKGNQEMRIKIKNVKDVIEESHVDIAKFDCEGAENSLIHLTYDTLRLIDTYVIEVHKSETRKSLLVKFQESGFICIKDLRDDPKSNFSVLVFKRKEFNQSGFNS